MKVWIDYPCDGGEKIEEGTIHLDSVKDGLMPDAGQEINMRMLDYMHFVFAPPAWRYNGF